MMILGIARGEAKERSDVPLVPGTARSRDRVHRRKSRACSTTISCVGHGATARFGSTTATCLGATAGSCWPGISRPTTWPGKCSARKRRGETAAGSNGRRAHRAWMHEIKQDDYSLHSPPRRRLDARSRRHAASRRTLENEFEGRYGEARWGRSATPIVDRHDLPYRIRPGPGETGSDFIVKLRLQGQAFSAHLAGEAPPPRRAPFSLIVLAGAAHLIELLSE